MQTSLFLRSYWIGNREFHESANFKGPLGHLQFTCIHFHRKGEMFEVNKRSAIICRTGILKNITKEIIAMI